MQLPWARAWAINFGAVEAVRLRLGGLEGDFGN